MAFDQLMQSWHGAPAYALALALTLVLAAFATPRRWWRRPTARGAAVLGGGTWAIGALLLHGAAAALPATTLAPVAAAPRAVVANPSYRVHRDLNVRAAPGVGSSRLAIVPAGSIVTATGERSGDWWQIRYGDAGAQKSGWASSLWLRRATEP